MTPLTELKKLAELQGKATEGPWEVLYEHPEVRTIAYIKAPGKILEVCAIFGCDGVNEETSNAELIAASRNIDLPALVAYVEGLERALDFIAIGCLVPPDGGSPCLEDAMEAARKALEGME